MNEPDSAGVERILGLDIALRCTGYGVIERSTRQIRVLDCGYVRTPAGKPVSECLRNLHCAVEDLLASHQPTVAAIEAGFYSRNARTAMTLGMARGAAVALLAKAGIRAYEYSPRRVKQAVCGYGNAGKEQVARLVADVLSLDAANLGADTTDALAVCLCHAHTSIALQGLHLPDPI